MEPRDYEIPQKLDDEHTWDWCKRVADAIPPQVLIKGLMRYIAHKERRQRPLWSRIGHIFGHGSGVSSAIVEKWYPEHERERE